MASDSPAPDSPPPKTPWDQFWAVIGGLRSRAREERAISRNLRHAVLLRRALWEKRKRDRPGDDAGSRDN